MKSYKSMIKNQQDCQCGICLSKVSEKELEIHHITFKSQGGTDARENLIALCSYCHSMVHKPGSQLNVWARMYNNALFSDKLEKKTCVQSAQLCTY